MDDEKLALDVLEGSIRKAAPEAEICAINDAVEALGFLKDRPCEVAFLDVGDQRRGAGEADEDDLPAHQCHLLHRLRPVPGRDLRQF